MLARELEIWSSLNHPNILPLFGYSVDDNEHSLSFISEWMDNGRADKYVQDNPNCDIAVLVSPQIKLAATSESDNTTK